ncbi:hypothetical protein H375_3210 [Rickettsia prowazekii str. Breinl]|nr:hypothetical protein H374_7890 [Rickettsia prowazekii str. NMRC Madrid E]AGJ02547.1 hypothetical protein H375_3210 [Rickettsia prowazekii str. Breinl]EOB10407.1 hypothetical protein H377_3810 [Rickettsia prowazekii str. Cairo 3]
MRCKSIEQKILNKIIINANLQYNIKNVILTLRTLAIG